MARAIKISSVSGALTVAITGPNGGTPVVYADSSFVNVQTMPATVADTATTTFWLQGPGRYTLSVKTSGGTEIAADNNSTRTVDVETDGTVAALNYDARTLATVSGDSGHSTASSAASLTSGVTTIDVTQGAYGTWNENNDMAANIQAAIDAAPNPGGSGNDWPATCITLPAGYIKIGVALKLRANVWLRGQGATSTFLVLQTNTQSGITLNAGTEVGLCISDLGIIGKTTATAGAGIDFSNALGAASILGDTRHIIRNVAIVSGFDGVLLTGTNNDEIRFEHVTVERPNRHGFNCNGGTDNFWTSCTVGQPGQTTTFAFAYKLTGANHRLIGCKAYGGGNNSGGYDLTAAGRCELSSCEAQDMPGTAFNVGTSTNTLVACLADSCAASFEIGGAGAAVLSGCIAVNRGGGSYTSQRGFNVDFSSTNIIINGTTANIARPVQVDNSTCTGIAVNVNGAKSAGPLAYAATITPDPWQFGINYTTLTGNVTIAAPTDYTAANQAWPQGHDLTFVLTQDGTGGRSVTWNAAYVTQAAIDATASSTTTITFKYDGAGTWREASRSPSPASTGSGVPLAMVNVNLLDAPIAGTAGTLTYNTSYWMNAQRFGAGTINDNMDWDVQLDAGTWRFAIFYFATTNRAIYTVQLADISTGGSVGSFTTVGTIDAYSASSVPTRSQITGIVVATAGRKRLRLLAASKNASSSSYFLEGSMATLVRTA